MKHFVVTGCGRSGTKYMSGVLTKLGLRTGHEQVFSLSGFHGWHGFDGESSGLAAPLLQGHDVIVFHQVRHPLEVISSHMPRGYYQENRCGSYEFYPRKFIGDAVRTGNRHWVGWNKLIEQYEDTHEYYRYRIEDIEIELPMILHRLDVGKPAEEMKRALGEAWRHSYYDKPDVSWSDFADDPEFFAMAERYGYNVGVAAGV